MRIPYGYTTTTNSFSINQQHASVVQFIYALYLQGKSLGRIADALKSRNIPSPTGQHNWTRASIDKLLTNGKYVPHIIPEEQFWKVQIEREHRTNIDDSGRRTARYTSHNVLSGLLICAECGYNYRRITRLSGEIVWRCADRVENGRRAVCRNRKAISDTEIHKTICEQLDLNFFDENVIQNKIDAITVGPEGITIKPKISQPFELTIL